MWVNVPLKVLQDVATRWNASFYMLERFVQLETSIRGIMGLLDNAPPSLNSDSYHLLNGMKDHQNWGNIENSKTLKRCTFLDPWFKNIPFTHNENMITSV